MSDAILLAWLHMRHHRGRSALLVLALAIVAFLPLAVDQLVHAGESALRERAESTALVAGADVSPLDVVLAALYFRDPPVKTITQSELVSITTDELGIVVPLSLGFQAGDAPLVGTLIDYFDVRGLKFASGRPFAVLGECVLGFDAAKRNGLRPGMTLTSEPVNMLSLAGSYPIRMQVVGVLERSGGPDDDAVFTDLRTTWVIAGLGHGHEDLSKTTDSEMIMGSTDGVIRGSAKVREYVEFNEETIKAVHFHGDTNEFPITSAIIVPADAKSQTILMGRSAAGKLPVRLFEPTRSIEQLLVEVFKVRSILLMVLGVVALAMCVLVGVVIALSIRIRSEEIETMHRVGCSPGRVGMILGAEVCLLIVVSGAIALVGAFTLGFADSLAVDLFTR